MSFQDGGKKFPRLDQFYSPLEYRNGPGRDELQAFIRDMQQRGTPTEQIEREVERRTGRKVIIAFQEPERITVKPPPIVTDPAAERKKAISSKINRLFPDAPVEFRQALNDVRGDESMNDVYAAFSERGNDWSSGAAMLLAASYLNPLARKHIDSALDLLWSRGAAGYGDNAEGDVIVGSGLHAAIYASIAHRKTGVKPVVITEPEQRVGGTFAMTQNPAFYLNSRNRPGPLGLPSGRAQGSLNYIPGAPVQPADLSGDEYADNATLGWAIRMTLAMHATVLQGTVTEVANSGVYIDGGYMRARRVIVATGIGRETRFPGVPRDNGCVLSYSQFMQRMDTKFPMKGMGRIAVIGARDGGKTVIEALTGQGPARTGWGVASIDYPEQIDWYSEDDLPLTCNEWINNNRSRYKGIGRNLPRDVGNGNREGGTLMSESRVKPVQQNATDISIGYDEVMVNGKPYDTVVVATGYTVRESSPLYGLPRTNSSIEQVGGMQVGRRWTNGGAGIYAIGPAATLLLTSQETDAAPELSNLPDNVVSIFRYARKTAALAESIN